MDKRIAALILIIVILLIGIGYAISQHPDAGDTKNTTNVNNTTKVNTTLNNTTVKDTAVEESSQKTASGQYGYCAVCGKALTYGEANNEYTQGKVCHSCANNPYYQTSPGADYANQKLKEAYPDEYEGMFEDNYEQDYNDYEIENDNN